jgi:hypothetical protein
VVPDAGSPVFDFPAEPVIDTSAPATAPQLFGEGTATGGPCLIEPDLGALFPKGWIRLRVRLVPPEGQNLFEIRIHVDGTMHDLVVYTARRTWTMPLAMWEGLSSRFPDRPVTITVRGASFDGSRLTSPPARGSSGAFAIAPVPAAGTIVYWTTSGGSALKAFSVGEETVRQVLAPSESRSGTKCVGCHSSTPDGYYAGLSASVEPDMGAPSRIDLRSLDGRASSPSYLSTAAQELLSRSPQQHPVFSKGHWSLTDKVVLAMRPVNDRWEIVWTDLLATAQARGVGWDVLPRRGDPGMAATAAFSHDGSRVAYCSAPTVQDGVNALSGGCDLYVVPFGDRRGGDAAAVRGASEGEVNEYYPAWSPDDELLAFTRSPGSENTYNNPSAEIFVVPATGGTAVRLAANDPPACAGRTSPGVTNSWPKWSPAVAAANGKKYYWLTFSSRRMPGNRPQILVAAVVVDASGITTSAAIYPWNQPADEANHTPAWDVFRVR